MKRILALGVFTMLSITLLSAQEQYSYSFKGVSDSTTLVGISKELEEVHGVASAKPRYKSDQHIGEFIITSKKGNRKEPYPLNPADIKSKMIALGLEPLSFRKIQ